MPLELTKRQAFRFLLTKHGLLGPKTFQGEDGVMDFIRQTGSIQYDPVDVCGKNADLTLQSRVMNYQKQMLSDLLYEDRKLIDYFDKNLCILPIEEWKWSSDAADLFKKDGRSKTEVDQVREQIRNLIREKGFVCSKDVDLPGKVDWYWSESALGRVALEQMYYEGELIIHHKSRSLKYYALTEDFIPEEDRLNAGTFSESERRKRRVLRRIGAVGLLWNRRSDAFLFIGNFKSAERTAVFEELEGAGEILPVQIEGLTDLFYLRREDEPLLRQTLGIEKSTPRVEFLAPLDPLLWDRNLIRALTGFDYTWEIYTVESKRKYGHYVLPMLYEDRLVGRVEFVCDRKNDALQLKNAWFETGWVPTKTFNKAFMSAAERFRRFNGCTTFQDLRKN